MLADQYAEIVADEREVRALLIIAALDADLYMHSGEDIMQESDAAIDGLGCYFRGERYAGLALLLITTRAGSRRCRPGSRFFRLRDGSRLRSLSRPLRHSRLGGRRRLCLRRMLLSICGLLHFGDILTAAGFYLGFVLAEQPEKAAARFLDQRVFDFILRAPQLTSGFFQRLSYGLATGLNALCHQAPAPSFFFFVLS